MDIAQIISMLGQVSAMMQEAGTRAGDLRHTVEQLQTAFELTARGYETAVNVPLRQLVETADGRRIEILRVIDVVAQRAGELDLHIEQKTGAIAAAIPTLTQAFAKGQENLQFLGDLVQGATGQVRNLWQFVEDIGPQQKTLIERRLATYAQFMLDELGATEDQVRRAIESFKFEDAEQAFKPALEFIFGPDGPIARVALQEASGSPNFAPAMEVLFGSSGKIADAATDAAAGVNFDPALDSFENKLETGVSGALQEVGDAAARESAGVLAGRIGEGARSLGNIMTSIPQLYDSVTKLGEAWDKPLNSTQDYMNLMAAAGGVINQGVQVFEAFAGVTKIATAVQAAFNLVMAANPVVLIVLAVIALIAVIALLIVYWDQVKAAIRDNPWIAIAASLMGIIGIIVVIIAYWDEIKLAVLEAANYISIQAQRIGYFFVGVGTLLGQVWDWIVATVYNAGVGIVNSFIRMGAGIINFFIDLANGFIDVYNSVAEYIPGLSLIDNIKPVNVEDKLIMPKETPTIDVAAAFATGPITGGLEGEIAAARQAVAAGQAEDQQRRAGAAAPPPPGAPVPGAPPALPPGLPGGLPSGLPAGLPAAPAGAAPLARPEVPPAAGAAAAGPVDASVTVNGGITVNISAERLEADAAQLLSDEIIAQLQARLGSLRSEQEFRLGARPAAA